MPIIQKPTGSSNAYNNLLKVISEKRLATQQTALDAFSAISGTPSLPLTNPISSESFINDLTTGVANIDVINVDQYRTNTRLDPDQIHVPGKYYRNLPSGKNDNHDDSRISLINPIGLSNTYNQLVSNNNSASLINDDVKPLNVKTNLFSSESNWQYTGDNRTSNKVYGLNFSTPEVGGLLPGGVLTYTQNDIIDSESYLTTYKVTDFRQKIRAQIKDNPAANAIAKEQIGIPSLPSISYSEKNIEKRVNLGDPGKSSGKNLTNYTTGEDKGAASKDSYDKITALPIYYSSTPDSEKGNDLVKFRIGVISNDNPSIKRYIHFRAFLNQITDNYTADWQSTQFIGRGEKFYNYTGFDRKLSLSWTVAAQSKAELIPMYKKLNYLSSVCAPDYSVFGYMRGNIVTLTIGGYVYEQPGIITGFNYTMNDDTSTWEIGINKEGENDPTVKELPHLIKVDGFNFIPIHNFVPKLQQNKYGINGVLTDNNTYGPERYIALSNGANNNYD